MDMLEFLEVDVEPGPASEAGIALRFKPITAPSPIAAVDWESDDGLFGTWRVEATDDEAGERRFPARAAQVEDSADGVVVLVMGGLQGLRLEHPSGAVVREAYLLLSRTAVLHP